jgi:Na+/proline symporter
MSTIDTHLNWGASYLINDIYRRFIRPEASERETVWVAKLCLVLMMTCAMIVAFQLQSIGKAWLFVWAMGAGIGPVLVLRWFWWRINAWSEIAALASSLIIAFGFEIVAAVQCARSGTEYTLFATPVVYRGFALGPHHKALLLVPISILVWVTVTLRTRPAQMERLEAFYRRVRPGGFWGPVARRCADVRSDGISARRLGVWVVGCAGVYGFLFGLGRIVLGEPERAWPLFLAAAVAAVILGREFARKEAEPTA